MHDVWAQKSKHFILLDETGEGWISMEEVIFERVLGWEGIAAWTSELGLGMGEPFGEENKAGVKA